MLANQAWSHATLGHVDDTLQLLGRAMHAFDRATPVSAPSWLAFYDQTDLSGLTGVVAGRNWVESTGTVLDASHVGTAGGSLANDMIDNINLMACEDATRYIVNLVQGGIGLPDESYFREERFAAIRDKYRAHIARTFQLAGAAAA